MTQLNDYLDGCSYFPRYSHREYYLEVGNAIADIVERENLPSEELDELIYQCFVSVKSYANHSRLMDFKTELV